MSESKEMIRTMFVRFCVVFTLIVMINTLVVIASGKTDIKFGIYDLGMIGVMSALCALGDLFFINSEKDSKRQSIIRSVIHYLYINVMVFLVILLNSKLKLLNAILVIISIAVIYWINTVLDFCQNKKDALKMNDILQKINKNDE